MIKGKLFVFGCSLTRYTYPTWGDILGQQWEYYENWGKPKAGNHYIFNSVVECLNRNDLDANDTIMILWSGIARLDYYQTGTWYSKVNEFSTNPNNPINCPDGYEVMNYPLMYAIDEILRCKNIKYRSMTWSSYNKQTPAGKLYNRTLKSIEHYHFQLNHRFYKGVNTTAPSSLIDHLYNRLAGPDWPSLERILSNDYKAITPSIENEIEEFKNMMYLEDKLSALHQGDLDLHPLPSEHLRVAQKICPDIKISRPTVDSVIDIENKMLNNEDFEFQSNVPKNRLSV